MSLATLAVRERAAGACRSCAEPAAAGRRFCAGHLEAMRQHAAERRSARAEQGLCLQCGVTARQGRRLCERCGEDFSTRQRQRAARKKQQRERMRANREAALARRAAEGLCAIWMCQRRAGRNGHCRLHQGDFRTRLENEYKARYVNARVSAGLCRQCGWPLDRLDRKQCAECRAADTARSAELRAERRAAGLCVCGATPRRGRATCTRCARKHRREEARRLKTRREAGLCVRCPAPALPGRDVCACHQRAREEYEAMRKRRGAGLVFKEAA